MNNSDYSGEKDNDIENKKEKELEKKINLDNNNNNINELLNINNNKIKLDENYDSKDGNLTDKIIKNNKNNLSPINIHHFRDLTEDSKCSMFNNSFCVFKSINNISYLIYTNEIISIISYNLNNFQKINEIKNAHKREIIGFRHCLDNINKRDLILSISPDNNLKLWDICNFELLLNFIDINKNGLLCSACFLNNNNDIYIITSNCNYVDTSEPIKVFNLNGTLDKIIECEDEEIIFIDIYYDRTLSMNFIISGGIDYVKSYDFNDSILYNKYLEDQKKDIIVL